MTKRDQLFFVNTKFVLTKNENWNIKMASHNQQQTQLYK
jgi:hypothetical protein